MDDEPKEECKVCGHGKRGLNPSSDCFDICITRYNYQLPKTQRDLLVYFQTIMEEIQSGLIIKDLISIILTYFDMLYNNCGSHWSQFLEFTTFPDYRGVCLYSSYDEMDFTEAACGKCTDIHWSDSAGMFLEFEYTQSEIDKMQCHCRVCENAQEEALIQNNRVSIFFLFVWYDRSYLFNPLNRLYHNIDQQEEDN